MGLVTPIQDPLYSKRTRAIFYHTENATFEAFLRRSFKKANMLDKFVHEKYDGAKQIYRS